MTAKAAPSGQPLGTSERAALAAYVEHTGRCEECGRRLLNCDQGRTLWDAYCATRATVTP